MVFKWEARPLQRRPSGSRAQASAFGQTAKRGRAVPARGGGGSTPKWVAPPGAARAAAKSNQSKQKESKGRHAAVRARVSPGVNFSKGAGSSSEPRHLAGSFSGV